MKRSAQNRRTAPVEGEAEAGSVRIIGGDFRGRRLRYSGDIRTRPMKDRVREAVFNLLADDVQGTLAIDLFAGTGVLALESLSRGASRAICIEQHFPTADLIRENATLLEVAELVEIVPGNTFIWVRRLAEGGWPAISKPGESISPGDKAAAATASSTDDGLSPLQHRWVVFCSPPYAFYTERREEMGLMLSRLIAAAPQGSLFVVEADATCDFAVLPQPGPWDIRSYPPAVVGIAQKGSG